MHLTLSQRLFLWALAISAAAIATVSVFYDREAESAVVQRAFDQLASVRALKKSKVEDYFESLRAMLSVLAAHPATVLTSAQEMSLRYGVSEILICTPDGTVLYAFHSTMRLGERVDSAVLAAAKRIGEAYSTAAATAHFTDIVLFQGQRATFGVVRIDSASALTVPERKVGSYTRSNSMLLPLHEGNYILVQAPVEALNRIMTEREGLGMTGESYIVGADAKMRTDSRFSAESTILRLSVETEPVRRAFQGQSGQMETTDYRHIKVISAFAPLHIDHADWAIIVELDVDEITTPINATRRRIVLVGISLTLVMTVLSWYGSRRLSEPIVRLQEQLSVIARGQIPEEPLHIRRFDEIGAMARELNMMTASMRGAALFARDIGAGKFDAQFPPRSEGDILVIALNEMKHELEELLEDKQTQATQRTLALVEGEERERIRISRDVHDGVGQILTALRFNLNRIADEQVRQELSDLADDAIQEVRAVSHNLMPGVLVDFGLEAALEHLCKKLQDADRIAVRYDFTPLPTRLDAPKEIAMYRIAQEALNNALRYADATSITLAMTIAQSSVTGEKTIVLRIADDGKGFNTESQERGNGLVNMRERAALFGGAVHIHSRPRSEESLQQTEVATVNVQTLNVATLNNATHFGTEVVLEMPLS
ncbi:MAG: histidine kinase [Candidatus Kapabacteria bacterium]|nr:histidine kinase [Candidatus Kapabacteria bacterium]